MPHIDLVDLVVEVDSWTDFRSTLTHVDNATTRSENHPERLLAGIVAHGCNFGIDSMARIAGFTAGELAWTNTWYLRTETVRAANDRIVNHQTKLPIAEDWGIGTLSSSDGQRFPVTVNAPRARHHRKYFTGTGATIYNWTSDRHAQYGTRVIPTTVREGTYVLDAIFDNETDLEIEEHTADTAGYTDLVYGLFDLTQAIQEYGRIAKTISTLRYLDNPEHRRRILVQLNKGETLHALRQALFFVNRGAIRRRHSDDQDLQGEWLTLLTNAIVCWNTVYISAALDHLRDNGHPITDEQIRHLSPTIHDHVNVFGRYHFHAPTAPAPGNLRPLRT